MSGAGDSVGVVGARSVVQQQDPAVLRGLIEDVGGGEHALTGADASFAVDEDHEAAACLRDLTVRRVKRRVAAAGAVRGAALR